MANIKENKEDYGIIIDGKDLILGRFGSVIAKKLLLGENVTIINCKDVVLIGKKDYLLKKYQQKREYKVIKKGPYFHRSPASIVRRALKNMLPHKSYRGREAFKKLKCYNSIPSTLLNKEKETVETAKLNYDSVFYYTKVGELSKLLGYNK